MQAFFLSLFLLASPVSSETDSAEYKIEKGKLHKGGEALIAIVPHPTIFKVKMSYEVERKEFVPVPKKILKGKTVMEFPEKFKSEEGYIELERQRTMEIPKARLKFVRRINLLGGKKAYQIKVLPHNNKTEIDITYNPELPSVGWEKITITFISSIPLLDGYEIKAQIKK